MSPSSETRTSKRLTSGPRLPVRRQPGEESVDQGGRRGQGVSLSHPADGLRSDPEPHLGRSAFHGRNEANPRIKNAARRAGEALDGVLSGVVERGPR